MDEHLLCVFRYKCISVRSAEFGSGLEQSGHRSQSDLCVWTPLAREFTESHVVLYLFVLLGTKMEVRLKQTQDVTVISLCLCMWGAFSAACECFDQRASQKSSGPASSSRRRSRERKSQREERKRRQNQT